VDTEKGACDCSKWAKKGYCKHVLAVGIHNKEITIPQEMTKKRIVKATKIIGAPKKVSKALNK
jgi:hypothetical protein